MHFEKGEGFHYHFLADGGLYMSAMWPGQRCEECAVDDKLPATVTVTSVDRDMGDGKRVVSGVVMFDSDVGNCVHAGNGHITVPYPYVPGDIVLVTIERTGRVDPKGDT